MYLRIRLASPRSPVDRALEASLTDVKMERLKDLVLFCT